jgi:transcriptional regulator with XRE-family HTH domain
MNFLSQKIKDQRKSKGLTQTELAEMAKVNLRTIQRIENAESEPRGKTLHLVCEALEIELNDLNLQETSSHTKRIFSKLITVFLILMFNLVLMGIIGFLTLDTNANANSLFGGVILSVLIPLFIVNFTKRMQRTERFIKFGIGYMGYLISSVFVLGLPIGILTGLIPCLLISLFFLYFGIDLLKLQDEEFN